MNTFRKQAGGPNRKVFQRSWILKTAMILTLVLPGISHALELLGEYRYAVQPLETLEAAKQTTTDNALRLAIVRSDMFKEATKSIVDRPLFEDLVDNIMSRGIEEVQVVAQQVQGRTVHTKIRATLNEETTNTVIAQALRGASTDTVGGEPIEPKEANQQNRALRILEVKDAPQGTVAVAFQALRRLDWMNTAYFGGLRDQGDILITFYNAKGLPMRTDRFPARMAGADDRHTLAPGQVGIHYFPKPLGTASYHVWVPR
jgi:hypothetical protein